MYVQIQVRKHNKEGEQSCQSYLTLIKESFQLKPRSLPQPNKVRFVTKPNQSSVIALSDP